MSKRIELEAQLMDREENALFADGLDDAIIGLCYREGLPIIVYGEEAAIDVFISGGMSHEEAIEYYEFNVAGAYIGSQTPIFVEMGCE